MTAFTPRLRRAGLLTGTLMLVAIGAGAAGAAGSGSADKLFETDVTNDLTLAAGEPMIGVDPTNPKNLAIIEFTLGSHTRPANTYDQQDYKNSLNDYKGTMGNTGRVLVSTDGGLHWAQKAPPPVNGGDPYLAYGPKGELYAGSEGGVELAPDSDLTRAAEFGNIGLSVSTDGGHSFSKWQSAGTPINRPWLVVDQSNGMVYTVSSGGLDLKTGRHNVSGPGVPNDRWLVTWKPGLTAKSEPRRLGGPDFSASGGSTIAAAHGVVAATFVLGGPPPGVNAAQSSPARPIPASLQPVVNGAVSSCSNAAPCLFFETTTDNGLSWTRHYVPTTDLNPQRVNVVADPARPGHYTIGMLNADRTGFLSMRTSDFGVTWSAPARIPGTTSAVKFKQWMAIGPSGVIGMVWKDRRDDLTPPDKAAQANQTSANRVFEAGFDVYSAISCDGGASWTAPVKLNAVVSPAGPPGSDDFAYMTLDNRYAHLVWGDRRLQPTLTNVSGGAGGVQTFYARLPFTVATHGTACRAS